MEKSKTNILVISEFEKDYNAIKAMGYTHVDYIPSSVVAAKYFSKERRNMLNQYHYVFVNHTIIDNNNFGNYDHYKNTFIDLLFSRGCLVIDYLSNEDTENIHASVYTSSKKTVLNYNLYHSIKDLMLTLEELNWKHKAKEHIPINYLSNIKIPLCSSLKSLKILMFIPYPGEIKEELKAFASNIGIKKLKIVEEHNFSLNESYVTQLADYDIILANSLYSSKLLSLDKEAAVQCQYVGKQLLMLQTYSDDLSYNHSQICYKTIKPNQEEFKYKHQEYKLGIAKKEIDFYKWLLETTVYRYITKRNSNCPRSEILEHSLYSDKKYETIYQTEIAAKETELQLFQEIYTYINRYFNDNNLDKKILRLNNINFKETKYTKDYQTIYVYHVLFETKTKEKYEISIDTKYGYSGREIADSHSVELQITKPDDDKFTPRKLNFTQIWSRYGVKADWANYNDIAILTELLQVLKQELKPAFNKIDAEQVQIKSRKYTYLEIMCLVTEFLKATNSYRVYIPGQIKIEQSQIDYKITCYINDNPVSIMTINKDSCSTQFELSILNKNGNLAPSRVIKLDEKPPYNEKELATLEAIQKKLRFHLTKTTEGQTLKRKKI